MGKDLEALESLDKLEECAYAMEDLPKSNWIDLAENEAELDLKIMNWVETIKFELFKGKQSLQRLEAIDNSNPSEALKYVNGKITDLEDDLQHYTMVEKDKCKEFFIREDLKQFTNIKQALLKAQNQEKILSVILKKRIDLESFYSTFVKDDLDYKYYEKYYGTYGLEKLTQEEFNSLKEVFGND